MRITELFTAQSIALDETLTDRDQIIHRLVELQATHGNITDKEAYKKALYAREDEGSTYVDNGITVPHAKTDVVTRPSLAALRLAKPVQYNPEDDGTTDLLFAIAAPENGSLHVDMLARMMQMLMNEDFVEKLKAAKTPAEFLDLIDAQEEEQFGSESFTQQQIPQDGYRILAVTACVNGIAHTYMAAEALVKAGDKLGLPTKVETNGSDGAKNILTREEIAACDGIIVAAEKKVETARFDGKPVLFTRVDDGIHKPEELIKKIVHGEVPVYHAEGGAVAAESADTKDSFGRSLYKNLMNGVSHMLPFVVGGGIMIALAFLLDDYAIDPSNFGMNTPVAAFFKTVGSAAFGYMLPILAGFIAMSIADRPGLAVGFAGGILAMNGTNFADLAAGSTTGISGGFLAALLAGFAAGYIVEFLKKITEKLPASLNGIRPMLIYPLGGILIVGAMMCAVNPVMGMINTAMTNWLNAMGGTSKVLLGAIVAGMMSVDMGGPFNKAAYVFGTAALASGNYGVMAAVMVGGMVPPIAIALSTTFCPKKWSPDERRNGIVNYVMGLCFVTEGAIPYAAADPLRVLPSCIAGSALAGSLSMVFGCGLRAPHGGIFVFPVVDHPVLYCVALAVGSLVGAVLLSLLKRTYTEA
ncbi:MAG: fructose-specific PTS transporter subunit EIIC [Faecalibacterium sp.]|nr:fructose-specific PTS transporter subunit EIIC [Faecalibacterium sp.]MDY2681235.1 fructose-specific PTS transporter subunit EIIC [Faecalibacterium prausnitzii]MDY5504921.1 fructose-specific PTS transporter subunit EIIC [Faecalibacterium sp.]